MTHLLYDFSLEKVKPCRDWSVILVFPRSYSFTFFQFLERKHFFDKQTDGHTDKKHWENNMSTDTNQGNHKCRDKDQMVKKGILYFILKIWQAV